MEPIAVTVRGRGRWVLVHRCTDCGRLRLNRAAGDDNLLQLMRLAALPLTMPPHPFHPTHAGDTPETSDTPQTSETGAGPRSTGTPG